MKVSLVSLTQSHIKNEQGEPLSPEALIVYIARVSNPSNQLNEATAPKLLQYCLEHKHWSVFESVYMTVEIETTRAISAQILRHRSFTFQEFSQRYAAVTARPETPEMRYKSKQGNRQGSVQEIIDNVNDPILREAQNWVEDVIKYCYANYDDLLKLGIAPECARMILPLCAPTRLYMTGNVRSWIHYLDQRMSSHAQKEHRDVAFAIKDVFVKQFPIIGTILGIHFE